MGIGILKPWLALRRGEAEAVVLDAGGWRDPWLLVRCGLYLTALDHQSGGNGARERAARIVALSATFDASAVFLGHEVFRLPERFRTAALVSVVRAGGVLDDTQLKEVPQPLIAALRVREAAGTGSPVALLIEPRTENLAALASTVSTLRADFAGARQAAAAMFEMSGVPACVGGAGTLRTSSFIPDRLKGFENGRPVVSVVMPARDASGTVEPAVLSVLRQNWGAIDLILVDDGSHDDTIECAVRAAAGDPRLRVIRHEQTRGAYAARNTGMALARGTFITFLDADDVAHPSRIERQVAAAAGRVASLSRLVRIDSGGRFVSPRIWPLVRQNPTSILVRREAVARAGPFDEAQVGADCEYVSRLRLLFGGSAVESLRMIGTVAMERPGSLTASSDTGIGTRRGALLRTSYAEAWVRRHSEYLRGLRQGTSVRRSPVLRPPNLHLEAMLLSEQTRS